MESGMDVGVRTRRRVADDTVGASDESSVAIPRLGIEFYRGDQIGDYVIEAELGRGGMGAVYAAVHPIIEKRVAIKILRRELSNNDEAVNRFVQEARAVNRIQHQGIVDVFGYGTTDDGCCFLVMELLEGQSLGRRMRHAVMSVPEICDVLVQITHALEAAHARGVVHRDLKPDNVFLVGPRVKLLDFGIAKLTVPTERAPVDYTQPGQAIGTPSYIAPEQARGVGVDGRTDIYSAGVMLFELLTGRLPFDSDNAMELIAHHITMPPPRPSDVAPGLPLVADTLVSAMLAKDAAQRPSLVRIRELLAELRATPMTPSAIRAARTGPDTTQELLARARSTRWWIPAIVGVALGVTAIVGWTLLDRHETAPAALPPLPHGPVSPPRAAEAPPATPSAPPAVVVQAPVSPPVVEIKSEPIAAPTAKPAPAKPARRTPAKAPAADRKPDPWTPVTRDVWTRPDTSRPAVPVEVRVETPALPQTPPPTPPAPPPSGRDDLKSPNIPTTNR
jgi:eukaryotic-like serine/threonine-protein kinase